MARYAGEAGGMSLNLEAALALAAAGLPVFPCGYDKQPAAGCRWTRSATTYAHCVHGMWKRYGVDSMPGIHLGRAGLIVLDLDRHEGGPDGVAAFDALCNEYGDVPDCPVVETPSSGFHLFFRQPSDKVLGGRTGALPKGIDIRGFGNYVIGVGAIRDDGTYYGAVAGCPDLYEAFVAGTIPEIPDWLVEIIEAGRYVVQDTPPQWVPLGTANPNRGRAWALGGLDRYAHELAGMPPNSGRNDTLNRHTFTMAGYAGLGVSEGEVWDAMEWACMSNGLIVDDGYDQFQRTFRSGWRSGIKRPLPGPRDVATADHLVIKLKAKAG
jgi:hypothetical protein